ncbi:MAG TPA: hypothetical protein VEL07_13780 [Planctomycetota bacterium]|nr:hypothetical protein [Planctomycetota bacterium]
MPVIRTLALIAVGGSAVAADLSDLRRVADLRLIGCSSPEFEVGTGGDDTDRGIRVGAGFFYSFVEEFEGDVTGPLVGLEVAQVAADGDDFDITVIGGCLHLGLAYQTDFRPVHTELAVLGGIGSAELEASGGGGADESSSYEWGARVGAFWTFAVGAQIGIDARIMRGTFHLKVGDEKVNVINPGFTGGVNLGWRF